MCTLSRFIVRFDKNKLQKVMLLIQYSTMHRPSYLTVRKPVTIVLRYSFIRIQKHSAGIAQYNQMHLPEQMTTYNKKKKMNL